MSKLKHISAKNSLSKINLWYLRRYTKWCNVGLKMCQQRFQLPIMVDVWEKPKGWAIQTWLNIWSWFSWQPETFIAKLEIRPVTCLFWNNRAEGSGPRSIYTVKNIKLLSCKVRRLSNPVHLILIKKTQVFRFRIGMVQPMND